MYSANLAVSAEFGPASRVKLATPEQPLKKKRAGLSPPRGVMSYELAQNSVRIERTQDCGVNISVLGDRRPSAFST